jgi:hypothetical protein
LPGRTPLPPRPAPRPDLPPCQSSRRAGAWISERDRRGHSA